MRRSWIFQLREMTSTVDVRMRSPRRLHVYSGATLPDYCSATFVQIRVTVSLTFSDEVAVTPCDMAVLLKNESFRLVCCDGLSMPFGGASSNSLSDPGRRELAAGVIACVSVRQSKSLCVSQHEGF